MIVRTSLTILCGLLIAGAVSAQTDVVMLWPNGAPGSENWTQKEATFPQGNAGLQGVRNIVKPSITVYLPADNPTGASVVIAPGGAFRFLSWNSEGTMVADWLKEHRVAAFVLKYRVVDTGTDEEYAAAQARAAAARRGGGAGAAGGAGRAGRGAGGSPPVSGQQAEIRKMAAADGLKAIEAVREHAAQWKLDPAKVGIMGFSAGGYVAMQAALDHTPASRPAFVAAIYACCENPTEIKIPEDAPPTFFLHAYNDPVSAESPALFMAWKAASHPAELHTYAAGGHGFGMPRHNQPTDGWIDRFGDWLRYQKLMQ